MAQRYTTELKVGLFVVAAAIILVVGYALTADGLRAGEAAYRLVVRVPTAEGLYVGTPVKLAGVEIGAVDDIELVGDAAVLTLAVEQDYELPVDSQAEVRSSGLLGDRYVAIELGRSEALVADGAVIAFGEEPGDMDEITRNVEAITRELQAIAREVREIVEDADNRENLDRTIENVEVLTAELRHMAVENRRDIHAIVGSVRRLSESLESFAEETRSDVDLELDKLHGATDRLDLSLENVQSITAKLDAGEGTIGALINDDRTVVALNETIEEVQNVVESFSQLHAEVYYLGRLYVGSQPDSDAFFYGNPLAPDLAGGIGYSGSNTIGIELHPQEDFWWIFEINDYPAGRIRAEQHFFPDQGVAWTEYTRELDFRFTFMMSKRWHDLALRLGLKEGGGGVGATWYLFDDRLQVMGDVFDFTFGSYPLVDEAGFSRGVPNLRLATRFEPLDNIWLEAGTEQVLLGLQYDYFTGYVGGGFHFTDDDIKLLFATLPLDF